MLMLGDPGWGHESGLFLTCHSLAGYFLAGRSCVISLLCPGRLFPGWGLL